MKRLIGHKIIGIVLSVCLTIGLLIPGTFNQVSAAGGAVQVYSEMVVNRCDNLSGWAVVDGPGALVTGINQQEGSGSVSFFRHQ